jgi:stearoyl-CoA desaturase (delta-9 desaturase)
MKLRASWQQTEFSWRNVLWIGAVHLIAIAGAIPFFSWQGLIAFGILYYVTGMLGITFCFHRLLTHHGYTAPRWLENFTALCGTLACQGGPINWVATHRIHHAYSDTPRDPHDITKGFWHSHAGWLVNLRCDIAHFDEYKHYAPDLVKRPFMLFLENNMIFVQVLLGVSLFLLGGFVFGDVAGGFDLFMGLSFIVYGIFVRMVAVYHITWFVNSASHTWGDNANKISDHSKNNWWVALLAFGEGWHNNHHAHARFARHGWHWWQFDQTWILIRCLEAVGILKDVVRPVLDERAERPQPVDGMTAKS